MDRGSANIDSTNLKEMSRLSKLEKKDIEQIITRLLELYWGGKPFREAADAATKEYHESFRKPKLLRQTSPEDSTFDKETSRQIAKMTEEIYHDNPALSYAEAIDQAKQKYKHKGT